VPGFPATQASLVRRVRSDSAAERERAHETIASVYWPPIYAHIRLTHGAMREDAEDLTQGFFAEALRRDLFSRYDPARARFRTYVRRCVDSFVLNERKAETRLKRGGDATMPHLDIADLEDRLAAVGDPDRVFHEEWVRAVFAAAVARLRVASERTGNSVRFNLFLQHDVAGAQRESPPSYADLAREFGLSVSHVTNSLAAARRDFRAAVLETLSELSGTDEELRDDTRTLLGLANP
jgi:DNA-directed RNA polymerase specialized sigma24 family protein